MSDKRSFVRKVYGWVTLAVEREKVNEPVFPERKNKAAITADICGVSRRTVFNARGEDEKNEYRALQYEIFYQEESYCNDNHTRQCIWQKDDDDDDVNDLLGDTKWKGGLKVPTGAGQRLIINHIGS